MPWCHMCRVEYPADRNECEECHGALFTATPPERRIAASLDGSRYVVVATLPPEQALVASERLDMTGIPNALRDAVDGTDEILDSLEVDVLVAPSLLRRARLVLSGRRGRTSALGLWMLIATAGAIFLSSAVVLVRWFVTGSPFPG